MSNSAPKNNLQQTIGKIKQEIGQPSNDIERISYGVITEVEPESSQVKVRFLKEDGVAGEMVSESFLPLINSLNAIQMLYGALRPGLLVRIFWRGKIKPRTAIVEVIADEGSSFLKKQPQDNEIETGPYKFLSGGLTG